MADEEVLFDDVYELCEIIGKWVESNGFLLPFFCFMKIPSIIWSFTVRVVNRFFNVCSHHTLL